MKLLFCAAAIAFMMLVLMSLVLQTHGDDFKASRECRQEMLYCSD